MLLAPIFAAGDVLLLIYHQQPPLGALTKLHADPLPNRPPSLSVPALPVPAKGWLTPSCPSSCLAMPGLCNQPRGPALPSSSRNEPWAPPQGCGGGTLGYHHPPPPTHPPLPSAQGARPVGAMGAPLPMQQTRALVPGGAAVGAVGFAGALGLPPHRRCHASLRHSAGVQEAAVGQGPLEQVRLGGRSGRVPPSPGTIWDHLGVSSFTRGQTCSHGPVLAVFKQPEGTWSPLETQLGTLG